MGLICIGFLFWIHPQSAHAADQVVTDCVNFTGPTVDIPITLDEAVNNAIATGGGTVTFACPAGTVIVTNFEMFISINSVTINGGGNVTIDANNSHRIAYINGGATLNLQNITIRNGHYVFGGALYNDGTLSLSNVTVQNSYGSSQGGAIYNAAGRPVTITNSTFSNNTSGSGGAIYTLGTANISTTTFTGSTCATAGAGSIINGGGNVRDGASVGCPGDVILSVSAVCIGADLQVTISAGDNPFQITADSGTLLTGLGTGVHTITGPVNETNVNVTELAGNTENFPLGNFNCFVSEALSATATCNGADLQIIIGNGNAPFSISVTNSIGTMNSGGNPLGVYTFTGPDTFTNIGITEDTGDLEVLNLPDVTCTAPLIPVVPPAPVVLSPDLTALGCVLTQEVLAPTAPDNTYCRVLMKNGAVVGYSGAVPQSLIDLGVIVAVDVYRLDGGQSITEFSNYTQVCLAGQGRLFYLDARTAPRVQVELQTENVDGFTCGWIPAVGTLVLTN